MITVKDLLLKIYRENKQSIIVKIYLSSLTEGAKNFSLFLGEDWSAVPSIKENAISSLSEKVLERGVRDFSIIMGENDYFPVLSIYTEPTVLKKENISTITTDPLGKPAPLEITTVPSSMHPDAAPMKEPANE